MYSLTSFDVERISVAWEQFHEWRMRHIKHGKVADEQIKNELNRLKSLVREWFDEQKLNELWEMYDHNGLGENGPFTEHAFDLMLSDDDFKTSITVGFVMSTGESVNGLSVGRWCN
ncbi:hypothetical protein C4G95_RS18385 [Vibrio parahaemolyticus]|nr:hypothetical protein [Vibrio parahaemolyticus]